MRNSFISVLLRILAFIIIMYLSYIIYSDKNHHLLKIGLSALMVVSLIIVGANNKNNKKIVSYICLAVIIVYCVTSYFIIIK